MVLRLDQVVQYGRPYHHHVLYQYVCCVFLGRPTSLANERDENITKQGRSLIKCMYSVYSVYTWRKVRENNDVFFSENHTAPQQTGLYDGDLVSLHAPLFGNNSSRCAVFRRLLKTTTDKEFTMPEILFYFVSVQLSIIKRLGIKFRDEYGKLPKSVWRDSNFGF